jgi:hypothetical protein
VRTVALDKMFLILLIRKAKIMNVLNTSMEKEEKRDTSSKALSYTITTILIIFAVVLLVMLISWFGMEMASHESGKRLRSAMRVKSNRGKSKLSPKA